MRLEGLIAATFTPMGPDGKINLSAIPAMVERLIANRITGIYICGSTGEGHSLTIKERKELAENFVRAVDGRIKIIVNAGHNSLDDASELTRHAASIGVDAVSAAPPTYYKIGSGRQLVEILARITAAAPELPFYYYHIPAMTGVDLDMTEFLDISMDRLPSLQGIKFTSPSIHEFQRCRELCNGKYQILYGMDEMLLSGLSAGADCMIGSTYNFMPAIYHEIIDNFQNNKVKLAAELQLEAVKVIHAFLKYSSLPAQKAIMRMVGMDCGPVRLPLVDLTPEEEEGLREGLSATELFRWSPAEATNKVQAK